MKTAIQQIIERFEHIQQNNCSTLTERLFFDGTLAIVKSEFLQTEEDQIKDAYNAGNRAINHHIDSAKDYYNEKYN